MEKQKRELFDKLRSQYEISFKKGVLYGTISRVNQNYLTVDFELGGYCHTTYSKSMIHDKLHPMYVYLVEFICKQLRVGNRVSVMYNQAAEQFELVSVQINGTFLFGNGEEALFSFDRNTSHVRGKMPPETVTPEKSVSFYFNLAEGVATKISPLQNSNNANSIRIDSPEKLEILYCELEEVFPSRITLSEPEKLQSRHRTAIYKALLNIPSEAKAKNFRTPGYPPLILGERIIGYLHPGSLEENEKLFIPSTQNCQFFGNCQLSEHRCRYIFYLLCTDEQTLYIYLAARLND